jgi:hypothetical protein
MTTEPFLMTGGCHCRALRYKLTAPPLGVYVCHCTDCQSLSGAAFAIGAVVPTPAFTLTGSLRLIRRVLGSATISHRAICPDCGVWVCGGSIFHVYALLVGTKTATERFLTTGFPPSLSRKT